MGGYTNVLNLYLRKLFIYYVNNTLATSVKKDRLPDRYDIDKIEIRKDLAF